MSDTQAYSLTISLPDAFQEKLEETVIKIRDYLSSEKKPYLIVYETGKTGKKHSHIMYMSVLQKTTSNETKKFKKFYPITKKEYPNAIEHKKHDNFDVLVGYCLKEQETLDNICTNMSQAIQDQFPLLKSNYMKQKISKTKSEIKSPEILTYNQIVFGFIDLMEKDQKINASMHVTEKQRGIFRDYLKTIRKRIMPSTYQKMNFEKTLEYIELYLTTKDFEFI